MSENKSGVSDQREKQRYLVHEGAQVINLQTGQTLGRLVNVHDDGMMIVGAGNVEEDCIYQLRVLLPEPIDGHEQFDLGADCLWIRAEPAEAMKWAGLRIIDLSDQAEALLNTLIEQL